MELMPENQNEVHGYVEKAAHGPSPWTSIPTTIPGIIDIHDAEGRMLAVAYHPQYTGSKRPISVEEAGANAALVAAAPEMLEALESVELVIPPSCDKLLRQIRNAIRKAKGEL